MKKIMHFAELLLCLEEYLSAWTKKNNQKRQQVKEKKN